MATKAAEGWAKWFQLRRDWPGTRALIPVATCYKILDLYVWTFASFGTMALIFVGLTNRGLIRQNPLYWVAAVAIAAQIVVGVFRGLPFVLRFAVFASSMTAFILSAGMVLAITPNWGFMVLILLSSVGLFFGTRVGLVASLILCLLHVGIAWGWVNGYLPVFMSGKHEPSVYMDYTLAIVWIRVLVATAGLMAAMQLLIRYVLRDLNDALKTTNSTLHRLAVEQEYRARAEEARLMAERASREAQKFDALGRLASGVAHDFNNALCVMKCWSSFLSEGIQDPLVKEAMGEIKTATDSATQLTHHLLAFSRSEPVKKEIVDLAEVVRLEGKTLARLLPKNVVVTVEAEAPVFVRLGRGQLQEIILNMAINARDAMPRGGKLDIRVTPVKLDGAVQELRAGKYAHLEIIDTGEGMDQATQSRIFEPFFTTKMNGQGTGLGLAMVFGLVAGAQGGIRVQSEPGRGTRFAIHLPEANPAERLAEPQAARIMTQMRCRVLVADDQPEINSLIERILSREGFPVITAPHGDAAVAALAVPGGKFGLLIVNGMMSGTPTARIIAQALGQDPECRVIITSAPTQDQQLLRNIEAGLYHLLPKPFDAGQLREAVNEALGKRA